MIFRVKIRGISKSSRLCQPRLERLRDFGIRNVLYSIMSKRSQYSNGGSLIDSPQKLTIYLSGSISDFLSAAE